jgi:chromosome partitioning protein
MLKASCWSPWPNAQLGCPSRRTARNARVAHVGLPDELERPRAAGCDLAVIDTPPGRSAETPAAVEASDFVLIPIWLESDDFDPLGKTAGTPVVGVLNFATPNSHSHEDGA